MELGKTLKIIKTNSWPIEVVAAIISTNIEVEVCTVSLQFYELLPEDHFQPRLDKCVVRLLVFLCLMHYVLKLIEHTFIIFLWLAFRRILQKQIVEGSFLGFLGFLNSDMVGGFTR
jgi:hypothetical protein